ncbi:MAG: hypothetical protein J0I06_17205 [Planctomycetes bacterium]|nr:hypothetical protein [Planctomycetota bacterium]
MKSLCAVVLGLVVLALAGSARADDAPKLLGKWEVTKSAGDTPVGTIVEFAKDGKMTADVTLDGKALKLSGTYKLEGTKLKVNLALNEQKIDPEFTVKFKGDDELELEDADKKVDTLKKKK